MTEVPAPAPVADNAAPAPVPAAAPATTATTSWRDSLPDDIKTNATLSKFDTIEGMAKSYVNLEKMLGAEKVPVPKEGDEEGTQRFFKAAGWPDKPEEYGFKAPEKLPDGMVYNAELDGKLAGIFHGSKLTASQAAKVREGLMEVVASGATESLEASKAAQALQEAEMQQTEADLKREWGNAYTERSKVAARAVNELFGDELTALFESKGLGNHPTLVRKAYEMGLKVIGEKQLIGAAEQSVMTSSDFDSAIADLRSKHGAALQDRSHPDHALRTAELTRLFERKFAGE